MKAYFFSGCTKHIYIILVIVSFSTVAFSQGSWNLEYIKLDALSSELINKEIRIDFKGNLYDSIKGQTIDLSIRKLLAKEDTVFLFVKNSSIKFKEKWKLFPDHGSMRDQKLLSISKYENNNIIIKEMYLKSIGSSSLTVEACIYDSKLLNTDKHEKIELTISFCLIKGLLINRT